MALPEALFEHARAGDLNAVTERMWERALIV
jgi:hypothetical protein